MKVWLEKENVVYVHCPRLGGRRGRQYNIDDAVNAGWRSDSFKNFADYSLSESYEDGIKNLIDLANRRKTAYMCSEALPWRCHRLLVSNTLAARGHDVFHIMNSSTLSKHQLNQWGAMVAIKELCCTYPACDASKGRSRS